MSVVAAPRRERAARPVERRLHRVPIASGAPRRLGIRQAGAAILIGPGSLASNPFQRDGIGQARAVILFRAWIAGELSPRVLRCARFSDAEITALARRRRTLLRFLPHLRGRNLRCVCPPRSEWCHVDTLVSLANR